MCLLILFLLAALACVARARKRRSLAWGLVFTLTILSFLLGLGSISSLLMRGLDPGTIAPANIDWKAKNAIVVLGAGTDRKGTLEEVNTVPIGYSRVFEGARRYFECAQARKSCQVILSGGDPWHHGPSEAEVMGKELEQIGVPKSAITLENNSNNTFRNADYTSAILSKDPVDLVVLVTSGFHLRRAKLYFSHFHVDSLGSPSDQWNGVGVGSMVPLAFNMAMVDLAIHEYVGIALYYVYGFMGWNK